MRLLAGAGLLARRVGGGFRARCDPPPTTWTGGSSCEEPFCCAKALPPSPTRAAATSADSALHLAPSKTPAHRRNRAAPTGRASSPNARGLNATEPDSNACFATQPDKLTAPLSMRFIHIHHTLKQEPSQLRETAPVARLPAMRSLVSGKFASRGQRCLRLHRASRKRVVKQRTHDLVLAARFARALLRRSTLEAKRAQGRPGASLHPRSAARKAHAGRTAQQHTGVANHSAFPARWLDGLCRALPGAEFLLASLTLTEFTGTAPVDAHAASARA